MHWLRNKVQPGLVLVQCRDSKVRILCKNVWTSDKSWEPDDSLTLSFKKSLSHCHTLSLLHFLTLSMSHSHTLTLSLSHSLNLHMLNNFCFHVYAQKSLSHSFTTFTIFTTFQTFTLSFTLSRHAQKSLFIGVFSTSSSSSPYPLTLEFIELVPS